MAITTILFPIAAEAGLSATSPIGAMLQICASMFISTNQVGFVELSEGGSFSEQQGRSSGTKVELRGIGRRTMSEILYVRRRERRSDTKNHLLVDLSSYTLCLCENVFS